MDKRDHLNKPIVAVSLALVLVLLMVVCVFAFGRPDAARVDITLPEPTETETETADPYFSEDSLLQITPENAEAALLSLKKPYYYHQSYSVSIGRDADVVYYVDLWNNGRMKRAEIAREQDTKIILTDGETTHIWYASDENVVSVLTDEEITFEDLLGIPGFDYIQTLREAEVTDAEYLVVEETQAETSCIFLSLKQNADALVRYWIDLSSGLLYRADCVEGNNQVYRVDQVAFDRLASEDEIFYEKFLLPDGTAAFTE